MLDLTIIPDTTTVMIKVPAEMVHKKLHIQICEDSSSILSSLKPDLKKREEIEKFCRSHTLPQIDYKFDRDEIHER